MSLTPSTPSVRERRSRRRARARSTLHSPAPSREIAPQQPRPSPSRCVGGKRVTIGCCPPRPQFHAPVQEIYDIGHNFVVTPNRQVCVTELAPGFVPPVPCRLRAWSVTELAPGFVSPVPCRLRVHARMHGRNHTNTHTQTHTHTHTQGSSSAIRLHWNRGRNHTHTHTHKHTHTHTQTHTHRGPAAK